MLEKEVERKMRKQIRELGGMYQKWVDPGETGNPDRIVITPFGVVWFVEMKTQDGRLRKKQAWYAGELKKRNANVCTIHGWDEAKKFIEEVFADGI
jgi:hypothetical protein